jgi:prepilin-type N-terminal cleavage/methylation domain-containing protein
MNASKNKGFTLIELMIVLALAAVAFTGYVQSMQQEANQLMAKKLGATEVFVYNNAVQKFLTDNSGQLPASVVGTNVGLDWLKSTACGGSASAASSYLPCRFLQSTGGKTTVGQMTFTTVISHTPVPTATAPKGFQARTVLSNFVGNAAGQTASSTLGLAAMVASTTFLGSDFGGGNSPGAVIYCPDLNPMPPGLAPYCLSERDQIVSYAFNNGANDIWLRVDHGNVAKSVIEYNETPDADPSIEARIDEIDARNNRHLRNVSRIYNLNDAGLNAGTENLIIGKRTGDAAVAAGLATFGTNGVIIDADMKVLGELYVTSKITSEDNIESTGGSVKAANDVEAGQDLVAGKNALVNGWISAQYFEDLNDSNFVLDPNSVSTLNQIDLNEIESIGNDIGITANTVEFKNKSGVGGSELNLEGTVDVSNLMVMKNGTAYQLEKLLPNFTLVQTNLVQHGGLVAPGYAISQCGSVGRVRVLVQPLVDEVITKNGVGGQSRYVVYTGGNFQYRAENLIYTVPSNRWAGNARAILAFYCLR